MGTSGALSAAACCCSWIAVRDWRDGKAYPLLERKGDAAAPDAFGIAGICSRSQGVLDTAGKARGGARMRIESAGAEKMSPTVSVMVGIMGANDYVLVEVC